VICILNEVVFNLGGMHIVVCLQNYAFEGLIHIVTVGVDAYEPLEMEEDIRKIWAPFL
jgi:hypothetical protein